MIEEGRHGRGQHGVVTVRDLGLFPTGSDDMRRMGELHETCPHGRRGFDRGPRSRRVVDRHAELAAAGADIEQAPDLGHRLPDQRRQRGDIVRRIDGRGIELERIDVALGRIAERNRQDRPAADVTTSPRTCSWPMPRRLPRRSGQFLHQDTPPNAFARDRCWWQVSWLAGPRFRPPSQVPFGAQWHFRSQARRSQLRGQPRGYVQAHAPRSLLIPCGNHRGQTGSRCEKRQA